jgi:hypothetical protein
MGEKTGQDTAWMRFSRSIRSGMNRSFQGTDLFSGIYELPFHHCRLTLDLNVQGIMIKDKDEGEDGSAGVRTQCMRLSRSKSNLGSAKYKNLQGTDMFSGISELPCYRKRKCGNVKGMRESKLLTRDLSRGIGRH